MSEYDAMDLGHDAEAALGERVPGRDGGPVDEDDMARRPGDRLVVAGAFVFLVGLVGLVVDVVPFFVGIDNRPLALNLLALLLPIGLGLALLGLLRAARDRRRRARELTRRV